MDAFVNCVRVGEYIMYVRIDVPSSYVGASGEPYFLQRTNLGVLFIMHTLASIILSHTLLATTS